MVETVTAHYSWTKPEVTKSASTWGGFLNNDLDAIDAQVFANQGLLANYLPLAGGTITGNLGVGGTFSVTGSSALGSVSAAGITASGNISASGNITSSSTVQGAVVNSTGNITASSHITASGSITASGNITAGSSFITTGPISGGNLSVGTITCGNIVAGGQISSYGFTRLRSVGGDAEYVVQDSAGTDRCFYGWQASTAYAIVGNSIGGGWMAVDQGNAFLTSAPNTYKPGGGAWQAFSDARIKTIDGEYNHGLAAVLALRPIRYHYRGNDRPTADAPSLHAHVTDRSFVGLVAQEVEAILPEMVSKAVGLIDGRPVADLRQLDTSSLVFALVNAVRELSAEIAALKARIP